MMDLELVIGQYPRANVIIKTTVGNYSVEDMISISEAKQFKEKLLGWAEDIDQALDHYLMDEE